MLVPQLNVGCPNLSPVRLLGAGSWHNNLNPGDLVPDQITVFIFATWLRWTAANIRTWSSPNNDHNITCRMQIKFVVDATSQLWTWPGTGWVLLSSTRRLINWVVSMLGQGRGDSCPLLNRCTDARLLEAVQGVRLYADLSGPGVYAAHLVSRIMLISTSAPSPGLLATLHLVGISHVFNQFSCLAISILVLRW